MKMLRGRSATALALTLVAALLLTPGGCAAPKGEGFAIYLTRDDVPPARMEALSHVELTEQPVIAADDIVAYDAATHRMTLTEAAFERVLEMQVPLSGRSFLVCVDRQPVYWGAFWTPISSMSFSGVTIMKPFGQPDSKTVEMALGYPSPSFYGGDDPRDSSRVLDALKRSGKLK